MFCFKKSFIYACKNPPARHNQHFSSLKISEHFIAPPVTKNWPGLDPRAAINTISQLALFHAHYILSIHTPGDMLINPVSKADPDSFPLFRFFLGSWKGFII